MKIGPIAATFQAPRVSNADAADMSGRIVGIGNDRRSRSSTQGEIRYRLVPIEAAGRASIFRSATR